MQRIKELEIDLEKIEVNENMTLNVLYQSNDFYAPITGVSLTSLLLNNQDIDEINIYLLNDEICIDNIKRFESICQKFKRKIYIINTEEILSRLKNLHVAPFKGTYTTYFKLFAVGSLNLSTPHLLQLDGDTIINRSLKPLLTTNIQNCLLAATYDCTLNRYKKWIDIPLTDKYYNCGVLYINQERWIQDKCEETIVNHLGAVRKGYYTVDQDIINVLFRDKIKYISPTYNFNCGFYIYGINESLKMYGLKENYFSSYDEIASVYSDPVIYHCMGAMTGRPWEQDSIHPQNELYNHYLEASPWRDCEKAKVKRKLIFRIQRRLYLLLPRTLYIPLHKLGQTIYLAKMNREAKEYSA